ncbi:517be8b7-f18e-456e-9410-6ccd120684d2 [Sclerotinia trifoliorum]|uniref:517be8b7-f18e-456e-9410-6ccd120684d2 n=1 Tax=Sclerotinia trifoliorum TaxID=28548 RepID=A0A8H2VRM1_9HELO|nr:517be8b7-f18e-456e-9410-6ccd120684d2 [Sclerotinia trifoliorum]
MLGWAKGLFSSQVEPNNPPQVPIKDQSDKIIEGPKTESSFLKKDSIMETPRESKPGGMEEHDGTSTKKSKKDKKMNNKMGGTASVLQRGYEVANSQGGPEDIATPEQDSAILPTPASELSGKKEKRKRRKSHGNVQTEHRHENGQAAGSEASPSEQIGEPDLATAESELANPKYSKSEKKRKHRKSRQEEFKTEDEAHALLEPLAAAHLADTEQQERDAEMQEDSIAQGSTAIHSGSKQKNHRKKQRSSTSHSTEPAEEETLPEEMEVQAGLTHGKEKSKKKRKSKLEKLTSVEAVETNDEGRDQDQVGNSVEKSTSDVLNNHSEEQIHLSKSNSGKRKKLIYVEKPDAEGHISDKPILPQAKGKKYNAKPKTSKASRTEASDENSAALLNQFMSTRKNPQAEAEPVVLSAKALGKRPAVDQPIEHQSKKRKQIDSDPRNGDIRSMFSDDSQHGSSKVAASKTKQRTRIPASNFEVSIPSPAVKTSRSGTEEMAAWSATDKRSASAGNNKDSSNNGSEFELEQQSDEAQVTRRKRYLPVDEPSLVGLGTSKSAKKPKRPKAEKSSITKRGKGKKESSNEVKPKRSRSQSVTRPKDGNGRLNEDETKRIADAVELYRADNDLEQQAVNVIIQGNAITDGKTFWDFMTEEVPDIPKRNLQSWCRRNFHNYAARGVWTTEQDEELMEVFNRMPKKWSLIGAELNRLPDDCRDRWRNYLSVTNLELGPWKLQEEQQLRDAVKKCIELIREDRRRDGLLKPFEEDDTYHEHDISWMKVSELMDLSRSHLQCYRKWKSIKAREHATTDDLIAERIVISNSWKNLKNYQEATKSLAAEKLQFLRAIRDSKAGAESKIDWRAIDEKLDRNHEAMEMRICLRGLLQNITGHTNKPLQEKVKLLIQAFEESAPHEPEGYVDLPFESTGLKKRTKRSKTSSLFENNPQLYDVGGSNSKSKMRHRMLNKDESQRIHNSTTDPDDGQLDTVQVPNSAKKAKRAAAVKKPTKTFALSTERVMDSESDEDDGAPTSAQKPRLEEEDDDDDDDDVSEPRAKTKQISLKKHSQRVAKTEIVEDSSVDEQKSHLDSDSNFNFEPEDVEMPDVQDDLDSEDSDIETSQSTQFNLGGKGSNRKKRHSIRKDAKMALDNSRYDHPSVDSDDDSEMEDPDQPQVPATPEYELQEGYSGIREQSADLDESGQNYRISEDEVEDDEESIMDDMSDIPANVVKKKAPGINGKRDVYFGKDGSVDLDQ